MTLAGNLVHSELNDVTNSALGATYLSSPRPIFFDECEGLEK